MNFIERHKFLKQKRIKRAENYLSKVMRWMTINLTTKVQNETVAINDLINLISVGAFYFVLLIFTFPVALPLPYPPGLPSLAGIPIIILSIQVMLKHKVVVLPKFIKNYRIKLSLIKMVITKSAKPIKVLSKIIKINRLAILTSPKFSPLYGLYFTILSICILIPFPGTNFIPAISIFVTCIGLLFKDGLLALIGNLIGLIGIAVVYIFSTVFFTVVEKTIDVIDDKIQSFYSQTKIFIFFIAIAFILFIVYFVYKKLSKH